VSTSKIESLIARVDKARGYDGTYLVDRDDLRALVSLARVAVLFRARYRERLDAQLGISAAHADMAEIERELGRGAPVVRDTGLPPVDCDVASHAVLTSENAYADPVGDRIRAARPEVPDSPAIRVRGRVRRKGDTMTGCVVALGPACAEVRWDELGERSYTQTVDVRELEVVS
jgi:hypothetical protein